MIFASSFLKLCLKIHSNCKICTVLEKNTKSGNFPCGNAFNFYFDSFEMENMSYIDMALIWHFYFDFNIGHFDILLSLILIWNWVECVFNYLYKVSKNFSFSWSKVFVTNEKFNQIRTRVLILINQIDF